jgi:hypothetical protein
MIPDKDVEQLLQGVTIRKRSDSPKLSIIVIESDDRTVTSALLRQRVQKKFPNHFYGKVTGSSFRGGIEFNSKGRTIRFVFKEASSSKVGMNTALMEAAQCIWLAAAQTKRGPITSSWVLQNVNKIRGSFQVSSPVDKVLDAMDDSWRKSSELIANHVYARLRHNNYVFHHDSQDVRRIYSEYSRLNRANKMFSQSDKWNPADIWAIRRGFHLSFSKIESFDELNAYMRELIDDGHLLPISLKKVGKQPKISTVNTNEAIQKAATNKTIAAKTEFVAARVNTGRTTWMSSKNCKIEMMKGKTDMNIEIRQSRPGAAINGELKVRNTPARHGKIHLKAFERIFNQLGQHLHMSDHAQLSKKSEELDVELIMKVFHLAKKLDKQSTVTEDEFKKFIDTHGKDDPDWLASKYEAMLVIDAFNNLSPTNKQHACERLYSQAAAANELAGPFLKVSQRTE